MKKIDSDNDLVFQVIIEDYIIHNKYIWIDQIYDVSRSFIWYYYQ